MPVFELFESYSLHHHHQGCPINAAVARGERGALQSAALQPFVVKYKASVFPVKQFDHVAPPVDKHKHFSIAGFALHLLTHHTAQGIDALAHIAYPLIKVEPHVACKYKHCLTKALSTNEG